MDTLQELLGRVRHLLYQEGGSFTHDGQTYDLDKALETAREIDPIKVSDAAWVLDHTNIDPEREQKADINSPVLVAYDSMGRLTVVDGAHRLHRAIREGVDMLPAREAISFIPANTETSDQIEIVG